jgi:CubicO group peptidase (beta-lactamase class C family)
MSNNSQTEKFARAYSEFKSDFAGELQRAGVVGASFALVRDNRVVGEEFYGMSDAEARRPVDAETIYHWASVTKTFTAIAIMQLRDRGLLRLDDPIVKYVPELRAVHDPFGDVSEITIRQLLTHSSGFRGATWTWRDDAKTWQPFEPPRWEQLAAMMPYTEVLFKPGSKYSYSNPGFIYLGRTIELLSHDDYEVYIDKNIFKPLEMYRSYFDRTPHHLLKHRSHSYYVSGGKRTEAVFDADTGITVANGGLNAPVRDMIKYVQFLLGDPARREVYDAVLKRSSLEEMWQPQLEIARETHGGERIVRSVGLSFFIEDIDGQRFVGHTGDQNAFHAFMQLEPATRTASILVLNTEVEPLADLPPGTLLPRSMLNQSIIKLFQALNAK